MKKFLLILGFAAVSLLAAPPTAPTVDAIWFSGSVEATISSSAKFDSLYGASGTKTILSNFVPAGNRQYVLVRDTISSPVNRDSCITRLQLIAKTSDGVIIGTFDFDTLGKGQGSSPDQYVIPFTSSLVGSKFDIKLLNTTAKDSVILNKFYIYSRKPVVSQDKNW